MENVCARVSIYNLQEYKIYKLQFQLSSII